MPFRMAIKAGEDNGREWRKSAWRVTDQLHQSRECPRCKAEVNGIAAQRDHWDWHRKRDEKLAALEEAVHDLAAAVRELAVELGHGDWYAAPEDAGGGGEDPGDAPPLTGYVLGNGPLPEEMRGGGE